MILFQRMTHSGEKTHSGKLQNVTHVDIIKMGMQFEAELKQRLKDENKDELSSEILAIKAQHQAEIDMKMKEMERQAEAYEEKLRLVTGGTFSGRVLILLFREKEDSLAKRVRASHDQWMRDIEVVIKSRCKAAVMEANKEHEERMEKLIAEMTEKHNGEKSEMNETHQLAVRQTIHERNTQTNEMKAALVAELALARKEISKLKYSEMERANYTDDLVEDIKLTLSEKHERYVEELQDKFEDEKDALRMQISTLDTALKEKEAEIERAQKETERSIKRREELLEKYRDYIHHTRPELTRGQIGKHFSPLVQFSINLTSDFMFEFP